MTTQEDIELRKKEKKIDRKHWMCRIQNYSLGIDAPTFYMGYCPFFWMTWVAVLIAPIVAFFNLLAWPTKFLYVSTSTRIVTRRKEREEEIRKIPLMPSDNLFRDLQYLPRSLKVITAHDLSDFRCLRDWTSCVRVALWLAENPNWRKTYLRDALKRLADIRAAERAREEKQKARTFTLRNLNKYVSLCGSAVFKVLIPLGIVTAAIGVVYGVFKLIMLIGWLNMLGAFVITSFVGALFMLVYLMFDLGRCIVDSRPTLEMKNEYVVKQGKVSLAFEKIGDFIRSCFFFIKDTVSMTYKQECPLIIWGEETGKIEKRQK